MRVSLRADVSVLEGRVRNAPKRIAFAVVNAINAVAKLAQRALVLQAGDIFRLRKRKFIEQQVAIIKPFASVKQGRVFAEIAVGQKPRLLLPLFERGGARVPFKGRRAVAVPVEARPSPEASVPESLWLSRLGLRRQAKRTATASRSRGGVGGRPGLVGRLGTYTVPGVGVFQRLGAGAARLLYVFVKGARLKPALRFVAIVQGVADRNFARLVRDEIRKALEFARGRQ